MSNEHDGTIMIQSPFPSEEPEFLPYQANLVDAAGLDVGYKPVHIFTPAQLAARDEAIALEAWKACNSSVRPFSKWWAQRKGKV